MRKRSFDRCFFSLPPAFPVRGALKTVPIPIPARRENTSDSTGTRGSSPLGAKRGGKSSCTERREETSIVVLLDLDRLLLPIQKTIVTIFPPFFYLFAQAGRPGLVLWGNGKGEKGDEQEREDRKSEVSFFFFPSTSPPPPPPLFSFLSREEHNFNSSHV